MSQDMDRRRFLKNTVITSAGAALALAAGQKDAPAQKSNSTQHALEKDAVVIDVHAVLLFIECDLADSDPGHVPIEHPVAAQDVELHRVEIRLPLLPGIP